MTTGELLADMVQNLEALDKQITALEEHQWTLSRYERWCMETNSQLLKIREQLQQEIEQYQLVLAFFGQKGDT